jgi:TetR/AcrR family transcriptional regulator
MPRRRRVSPDRILAAAALEFAGRGFAGARVDRIARRARVNKAMLYYHFRSKQALYRTLLRDTFAHAAARLEAIAAADLPAPDKMDRIVDAIAAFLRERPFFPRIMLREMAEGGEHLDRETLATMAALPRAVAAIVAEGRASGVFGRVPPVFVYFDALAPMVFFAASAPIRTDLLRQVGSEFDTAAAPVRRRGADPFVAHVQASLRRTLARDPLAVERPT